MLGEKPMIRGATTTLTWLFGEVVLGCRLAAAGTLPAPISRTRLLMRAPPTLTVTGTLPTGAPVGTTARIQVPAGSAITDREGTEPNMTEVLPASPEP